jgi:hypothetical protein
VGETSQDRPIADASDGGLEAPAPSRDDTRYPRRRRRLRLPGGTPDLRQARALVFILVIVASFVTQRLVGDDPEADPSPPDRVAELDAGPEVHAYLDKVQTICRAHNREIERSGKVPVAQIVRSETAVTSEIASLRAPPAAREIRRHLLAARRRIDETSVWIYRRMARSRHPARLYREELAPVIQRRAPRMYETFGSYGVRCNTGD